MSEYGEVLVTRAYNHQAGRECFRIHRADPKALISEELLEEIERVKSPWVNLDGDVLTITDDYGHRFIYRIGKYHSENRAYEMEWPD